MTAPPDLPRAPDLVPRWVLHLSLIAVAAVFGACSAVLALLGVGAPFLVAALAAGGIAGASLHAVLRVRVGALSAQLARTAAETARLEAAAATLRHDLRGVLSPALMMADRLGAHADPAVQRAGEIVGRSIDRATALLAASRPETPPQA